MNQLYFSTVLNSFNEKKQHDLNNLFEKWKKCRDWGGKIEFETCDHQKLIDNIKNEHFLSFSKFSEIMSEFLAYNYADLSIVLDTVRARIFQDYLLQGGPVLEKPLFFGTSILKDIFENNLLKLKDKKFRFTLAEIDRLLQKEPEEYNSKEKNTLIKLAERLIWVTWDEFGKRNPFYFLENLSGEEICNSMALDDFYRNKQLLVFYFAIDQNQVEDLALFRPTWCDANFFDKFSPTNPEEEIRWGQTFPSIKFAARSIYQVRRPEGVIKASEIPCKRLHKRIKIISV